MREQAKEVAATETGCVKILFKFQRCFHGNRIQYFIV